MLLSAAPAYAGSVSVTATASGTTVDAQVSGVADNCSSYCTAQTATVTIYPGGADTTCTGDAGQTEAVGSLPLSTSGGAFSFAASAAEQGGQSYAVCAYIDEIVVGFSDSYVESAPAVVTTSPQPCASGTSPELSFSGPSVVVYGRQGDVSVNSTAYGGNPTNAVLTMQAIGSAQPFYAHAFTSNELNNVEAENTLTFFIEFSRRDGPAVVTLAYEESVLTTTLSSAECTMSKSVQVSPIVGAVPTARFVDGHSNASILFAAHGGCSQTRIVPATVTVTGHGAHLTARTDDACSGHWTRQGRIPGVSTGWTASSARGTFSFGPNGSNESYDVTVRVNGHVVSRGSLNAVYFVVPSKRIWEGTDAFVNYCIDGNHTVYSLNNNLYCWDPGSTLAYVNLSTT